VPPGNQEWRGNQSAVGRPDPPGTPNRGRLRTRTPCERSDGTQLEFMRLFHWTSVDAVPLIQENGWDPPPYNSEGCMEIGIWFAETPATNYSMGRDALLAIDFHDGELPDRFRSRKIPDQWQIPTQVLRYRRIHSIDCSACSKCGLFVARLRPRTEQRHIELVVIHRALLADLGSVWLGDVPCDRVATSARAPSPLLRHGSLARR
jgi:hypothetical protein